MSVWNAILQATHSALIDEMNSRFPDEKIELGLPKRFEGFGLLVHSPNTLFWTVRSESEGDGFCAVAGNADQSVRELESIFTAMRGRAVNEFKRRRIAATFGEAISEPPAARLTIWLPMVIRRTEASNSFDLGLGVDC